jgi:Tfp pilus assembly protein PilF
MANAADLTRRGIAANQAGDRTLAAELFRQATETDPRDEQAWLWRSSVATTDDERRGYLRQALLANPQSEPALRGLALLEGAADLVELGGGD